VESQGVLPTRVKPQRQLSPYVVANRLSVRWTQTVRSEYSAELWQAISAASCTDTEDHLDQENMVQQYQPRPTGHETNMRGN